MCNDGLGVRVMRQKMAEVQNNTEGERGDAINFWRLVIIGFYGQKYILLLECDIRALVLVRIGQDTQMS